MLVEQYGSLISFALYAKPELRTTQWSVSGPIPIEESPSAIIYLHSVKDSPTETGERLFIKHAIIWR